jgi:hypothetical protein
MATILRNRRLAEFEPSFGAHSTSYMVEDKQKIASTWQPMIFNYMMILYWNPNPSLNVKKRKVEVKVMTLKVQWGGDC